MRVSVSLAVCPKDVPVGPQGVDLASLSVVGLALQVGNAAVDWALNIMLLNSSVSHLMFRQL